MLVLEQVFLKQKLVLKKNLAFCIVIYLKKLCGIVIKLNSYSYR